MVIGIIFAKLLVKQSSSSTVKAGKENSVYLGFILENKI